MSDDNSFRVMKFEKYNLRKKIVKYSHYDYMDNAHGRRTGCTSVAKRAWSPERLCRCRENTYKEVGSRTTQA